MLLWINSVSRMVRVCDMSGKEVTQWSHTLYTCTSNVLTIVSDQVVIADPPNNRITVYSLTGQILRHVTCSLLSNSNGAMCAVDDFSVLYSEYDSSKVFRVNITTGHVMWICSDIVNPQGITCFSRRYALVASYNCNRVMVLDINTGKYLQHFYYFNIVS